MSIEGYNDEGPAAAIECINCDAPVTREGDDCGQPATTSQNLSATATSLILKTQTLRLLRHWPSQNQTAEKSRRKMSGRRTTIYE